MNLSATILHTHSLSLYMTLVHQSLPLSASIITFPPIFQTQKKTIAILTSSYVERFLKMSCNGCRVLRKGCSENCMLRQSLQCINNPQAQAHATVFVAKFFGRAGLMSFLSSVAAHQRPALFQSLLFEAVGRAVNPVSGAVGLLWTGNWNACLPAVQTVLRGGTLQPLPEFSGGVPGYVAETLGGVSQARVEDFVKTKGFEDVVKGKATDLDLCLMISNDIAVKRMRESTSSEESETTTLGSSSNDGGGEKKLLRLFI